MRKTHLPTAACRLLLTTLLPAVGCTALLTAPLTGQEETDESAAVLAAASAVLEGISHRDAELVRSVADPALRMQGTTVGGVQPASDLEGFLRRLEEPGPVWTERMWDPVVHVEGRIATVRAPYDFYVGDELSHCGVDAFQLVRTEEGWRVASIVWTRERPPACDLHPDGPPGA